MDEEWRSSTIKTKSRCTPVMNMTVYADMRPEHVDLEFRECRSINVNKYIVNEVDILLSESKDIIKLAIVNDKIWKNRQGILSKSNLTSETYAKIENDS